MSHRIVVDFKDKIVKLHYELLQKYKNIFRKDLPEELSLRHALDYIIDTNDHNSTNKIAYLLSMQQLQKQIRQIEELLKRKLIRENIFS